MKKIELTQGQVALVDDVDYEYLNQFNWRAIKHRSGNFYASRRSSAVDGKRLEIYMHRQLLGLKRGDKRQADHENHRTLDNQRDNLRICTNQQNQINQKPAQNSTSRFKGVSWHKVAQKWQAAIQIAGKQTYLGLYVDEELAAMAYDMVARKAFGEFARLNFLPLCVSLCGGK